LIYATLLNPALDVYYEIDELQCGSTLTDTLSEQQPAGKGLNVAKVITALGEEVTVTGVLPQNSRGHFVRYCEQHSIIPRFVPSEGNVRINTSIVEKKNGQVTHISSVGIPLNPRIEHELELFAHDSFTSGDYWAFCGSLPRGMSFDFYQKLIQHCGEKSVHTILDTRGEALKLGIRACPEMIKPNHTELEEFFGEEIHGVHHIALKGKRLVDMGVGYVFISLGSDGMIAIHENDCLLCSAPQVKTVDTVGCGDALVAGVLVGKIRHFSFSEMCRMAVACGASNAMHRGPGNINLQEVWQLMEDVGIENV